MFLGREPVAIAAFIAIAINLLVSRLVEGTAVNDGSAVVAGADPLTNPEAFEK